MPHPESDYINGTYTIRDMRLPSDVKLTRTSLIRWVALSLGLLSEDESRTTIIPVLDAFFQFQLSDKRNPSVRELAERAKVPEKAVRYHLGRLISLNLVEHKSRRYLFRRDSFSNDLSLVRTFKQHYSHNVEGALRNVETALSELQRDYSKK